MNTTQEPSIKTSTYTVTTQDGEVHQVKGTEITTESFDGHLLLTIADQSGGGKRTVAIFRSWDYVTFSPEATSGPYSTGDGHFWAEEYSRIWQIGDDTIERSMKVRVLQQLMAEQLDKS